MSDNKAAYIGNAGGVALAGCGDGLPIPDVDA